MSIDSAISADLRAVLREATVEGRVYRSTTGIWSRGVNGTRRVNRQVGQLLAGGWLAEDARGYFSPTTKGRAELARVEAQRERNHATGGGQ